MWHLLLNPRIPFLPGAGLAILLGLCTSALESAGAAPAETAALRELKAGIRLPCAGTRVLDLAKDSGGQLWALVQPPEEDHVTLVYGADWPAVAIFDPIPAQWRLLPPSWSLARTRARKLIPLQDGRIACLRDEGAFLLLTRMSATGGGEVPWCRFDREMDEPVFLPLRHGGLVITGRAPFLRLLQKEAVVPLEIPIPEALWQHPETAGKGASTERNWLGVSAMECPDGSLVLWWNSLQPAEQASRLEGMVRWLPGEGRFEAHQLFGEGALISALIQDGPDHLLAAVTARGLFRISLADFSASLMPGPPVEDDDQPPFDYIEKLAWAGSRLYVVTCPRPAITEMKIVGNAGFHSIRRTTFHPLQERAGILWCWDWREASFQPLIQGLDREPPFDWNARPVVPMGKGLLVGSSQERPWWLPRSGIAQAFQLGEDQGFRLRAASQLEPLPNGKGLLGRDATGYAAARTLPGIAPEGCASRMRLMLTDSAPVRDRSGHLWAFGVGDIAFGEWNGQSWRAHALPLEMRDLRSGSWDFATDGSDQAWLLRDHGDRTAVFDFITAEWEVFDTLTAAVKARLFPGHEVSGGGRRTLAGPLAARNGSKGFFLQMFNQANVLAEGKWHPSEWNDINGGKGGNPDGPPWFSEDGAFCLPTGRGAYRTLNGRNWTFAEELSQKGSRAGWNAGNPPPPEGGWGIEGVESATEDVDGVVWLITSRGGLWKWLAGKRIQVLDHRRPVLLPENAFISQVLRDSMGSVLLVGGGGGGDCFRNLILPSVRKPGLLPAPEIASDEGARTVVKTGAPPGSWLRWKLDEATWSALELSTDGVVGLPILPPGLHVVEVAAFDEELSPLGKTRTLTFEVSAPDESGLLALVEQLRSGSPDEREAAARILRVQGPAALPVLQKITDDPATGETLRWWLRAVIQGIQNCPSPAQRLGSGR